MAEHALDTLEVIGCTEVPVLNPAMPRILSAVFRSKNSGEVHMPPYLLDGNTLLNPVTVTQAEFDDLVRTGMATSRNPEDARPGWLLWLDDAGDVRYQPASQVTRLLTQEIYERQMESARNALHAKDYHKARLHARIARSANLEPLDPLVIRAAAEHLMTGTPPADDIKAELEFTEEIAAKKISVADFRRQYRELADKVMPARNKCAGMATKRPSYSMSAAA